MAFQRNLDYVDVATRLTEMRVTFPDLTMQQVSMEFVNIGGKDFVVYTAAAYRTSDDQRPGIGTAWEPVPGPTSFTKDSEVQNAETAAWGRALIAIGASTKSGIASMEEVTNRSGEAQTQRQGAEGELRKMEQTGEISDEIRSILEAADADPSSEFLNSLATQYKERGTLTENQVKSGSKAAKKVLEMRTSLREAPKTFVPPALRDDEERF